MKPLPVPPLNEGKMSDEESLQTITVVAQFVYLIIYPVDGKCMVDGSDSYAEDHDADNTTTMMLTSHWHINSTKCQRALMACNIALFGSLLHAVPIKLLCMFSQNRIHNNYA